MDFIKKVAGIISKRLLMLMKPISSNFFFLHLNLGKEFIFCYILLFSTIHTHYCEVTYFDVLLYSLVMFLETTAFISAHLTEGVIEIGGRHLPIVCLFK